MPLTKEPSLVYIPAESVGDKLALFSSILARAVGVAVGRRSGGRLATTLVATKNVFIFFLVAAATLQPPLCVTCVCV